MLEISTVKYVAAKKVIVYRFLKGIQPTVSIGERV